MVELLNLLLTSYFLSSFKIIFTILFSFVLYKKVRIHIFDTTSDLVNTNKILKYIKENNYYIQYSYLYEGKIEPEGFCFNRTYLAYVSQSKVSFNHGSKKESSIWYIGVIPFKITPYDENEDDDSDSDKTKNKKITLYLSNKYYDGYFEEIELPFNDFNENKKQKKLIDSILDNYKENRFKISRNLIYGSPGSGKSFIGKLIASKLDTSLCFDLKLEDPGTSLLTLWKTVRPTKEKPMVIQIDEFDVLINKLHNNKIEKKCDWMRYQLFDKQSYNTFMSEYLICLPYVIYIFTMNVEPDIINKMDKSYIRENRIDKIYKLEQ
jgi:hypothetical protein